MDGLFLLLILRLSLDTIEASTFADHLSLRHSLVLFSNFSFYLVYVLFIQFIYKRNQVYPSFVYKRLGIWFQPDANAKRTEIPTHPNVYNRPIINIKTPSNVAPMNKSPILV